MSTKPLPDRVTEAKGILERAAIEYDDLEAGQMANLQEAIEFLNRLETAFHDDRHD